MLMGTLFHVTEFSFSYDGSFRLWDEHKHAIELVKVETILGCDYDICDDIEVKNEMYSIGTDGIDTSKLVQIKYLEDEHVFYVCKHCTSQI